MEMNDVDIENNKNKLDVNNTLYGINNEVYTIESIEDNQINIIYYRKLYITYNLGNNQETRINEEDYNDLLFLCNKTGMSKSDLLRKALREYIDRLKKWY